MDNLFKDERNIFQRCWDNIVYYCWDKPKTCYYDLRWYFSNRILFNKVLKEWRPWDSQYQLDLFAFGLEQLAKCIENGHEEQVSRGKKVKAINKLIVELKRDVDDEVHKDVYGEDYIPEFTIDASGCLHSNTPEEEAKKLYKKYEKALKKANDQHFETIYHLIKGQDQEEIEELEKELLKKASKDKKEELAANGNYKAWAKVFDGSGIYSWWD